jgi:fatty acid desaturase
MWYLPKVHVTHAILFALLDAGLIYRGALDQPGALYFLPLLFLASSVRIEVVSLSVVLASAMTVYFYGWSWSYLAYTAAAVVLTFPLTALLHNAAHGNIRPKWFGRLVGELTGVIQLSCFADWAVIHVLHHAHSDDPNKDPHPPGHLSYMDFVRNVRQQIVKVFGGYFVEAFKSEPKMKTALKCFAWFSRARQFMWVAFWFLLLGPKLFSFGFSFSIAFKMAHYAWFNWSTHRPNAEGKIEIHNHDRGLYKAVNLISANLYYHGNHHINMKLFNPKSLKVASPQVEREVA